VTKPKKVVEEEKKIEKFEDILELNDIAEEVSIS